METIIDTNQSNTKISPWGVAFKWGSIGALLGIVHTLIEHVLVGDSVNQKGSTIRGIIAIAIAIFTIVMSIKEQRDKNNEGFISFGEAFKTGFFTSIIAVTILSIFTYIYMTYFIDYEAITANKMNDAITEMKNKGLSEEQIKEGIAVSKKFMTPAIISTAAFFLGLILDTIIALICAAVLKKEQPQYA